MKRIFALLLSATLTVTALPKGEMAVFASETTQQEMERGLPSSVDLSEDEYFPAVGDQSFNGNCGYWSGYYTSLTFLYNKAHGIETTPDTCLNPIFGFAFYGRSLEDAEKIAQQIGYPTMGALPLDHYGTNSFSPYK